MRSYSLLSTVIGMSIATQAHQFDAALEPRQAVAFWGGFTLAHSGSTCPANTFECTGKNVNGNDNMYSCCPEGTYCFNNGWTYCCPDTVDCQNKLSTNQVCADTTWTLWDDGYPHGPFCCQKDETPIADGNAPFGECWSAGLPVISSEIASTLPQVPVTFLPFSSKSIAITVPTGSPLATPATTSSGASKTQSAIAAISSSASKITLSRTAIIGIAVGGGVFLILLALGVGCCCWKCCCQKRSRKQQEVYSQTYEPYRQM